MKPEINHFRFRQNVIIVLVFHISCRTVLCVYVINIISPEIHSPDIFTVSADSPEKHHYDAVHYIV